MRVPSLPIALAALACVACASSVPPANTPDAQAPEGSPPAPAASSAPAGAEPEHAEGAPEHAEHAAHPALHAGITYILPEGSEARSQSPINIVSSRAVSGKHQVKFHYQTSREHVENLGHTVKVTYDPGSSVDFDGTTYDLLQFHFHTPSEHLVDGVTYPLEMHLVHAQHGHPERLLVIGVLFKEGDANTLLNTVIHDVPAHAGEAAHREVKLDASSIFQPGEGYFHYDGSLTTPPFSESVTWLVLDRAHEASAEQVEALNRVEGNNARHIQALGARRVDHAN